MPIMPQFRLSILAQLARQMGFAPLEVRLEQLARAEALLLLLDPAKAYPLDFVVYRITDYRPKDVGQELLTGLALQHDLGLLIEQVSDSLNLPTAAVSEPVLGIEDLCQQLSCTSKTIQRWRRKGLPARRFIFPDGKRRVGFLLSSVERFLSTHVRQVVATANLTPLSALELGEILRRARRLAAARCSAEHIARRIARRLRRSPLTILHTLRKHDQEHPEAAILAHAAQPLSPPDRSALLKARRRGATLRELARRFDRPCAEICRTILDEKVHRLSRRRLRFHDDPLFHQPDAAAVIESLLGQEDLNEPAPASRLPRDLPAALQTLYHDPLLGKSRERALFLKLNYHKFQFTQLRRRLEPELAGQRDLNQLELHLNRIAETRNAIVRANLRLVASIARKHLRPGIDLMELVSDGALTLMRAVDGFDVSRGHRFSTYATLALMKGFARSVPRLLAGRRGGSDPAVLETLADRRPSQADRRLADRDQIHRLLSGLSDRERQVVSAHFGLGEADLPETYEQVARRLGLSKERVRQIEQSALAKLRAGAELGSWA